MIAPVTKQIVLPEIPDHVRGTFRLDTADGRFNLAEALTADINEWCKQAFDDGPRDHLGASKIGEECPRALWYSFRWWKHKVHSGQMQRLFQDGHWYEERFIEMLRGIGCEYTQIDPETQKQIRISDVGGHFGGSCDGLVFLSFTRYGQFPRFLAEFKTINRKGFTSFHDVEQSKPVYWAQMCVYGFKLGITHALFFIVNKDNSDIYIECVELDYDLARRMLDKAQFVILSPEPPTRLTENSSDFRCKICDYHAVCHLNHAPDRNCRTCRYSQPVDNAEWVCNHWQCMIPGHAEAMQGCQAYEQIAHN